MWHDEAEVFHDELNPRDIQVHLHAWNGIDRKSADEAVM